MGFGASVLNFQAWNRNPRKNLLLANALIIIVGNYKESSIFQQNSHCSIQSQDDTPTEVAYYFNEY